MLGRQRLEPHAVAFESDGDGEIIGECGGFYSLECLRGQGVTPTLVDQSEGSPPSKLLRNRQRLAVCPSPHSKARVDAIPQTVRCSGAAKFRWTVGAPSPFCVRG